MFVFEHQVRASVLGCVRAWTLKQGEEGDFGSVPKELGNEEKTAKGPKRMKRDKEHDDERDSSYFVHLGHPLCALCVPFIQNE